MTGLAVAVPGAKPRFAVRDVIRRRAPEFVRDLAELVTFPTISALPSSKVHMAACARWLARYLRRLGARDAEVVSTRGHPVVLGRMDVAPELPTVLFYGHYDVQPVEPLSLWRANPFQPVVRNGYLYGRGSSDDKGQFFAHLAAVRMLRDLLGTLPVNVAFLIEGGEEVGSPGVAALIAERARYLASDVAVVSDMPVLGPRRPTITYGLRGDLYLDVEVAGLQHDVHSGLFGGATHNPLRVLVGALSTLHSADGSIAVPGFFDDVRRPSPGERRYMRRFGPDDSDVRRVTGGAPLGGESGFSAHERSTIRPSLELAGIAGGYAGRGVKGIIPARARAKLDVRLVARQDPDDVHRRIFECLRRRLPRGVTLRTRALMKAAPVELDRRHPAVRAAVRALTDGFGAPPVFVRSGGSIPVVSALTDVLSVPVVLMGFALPDDAAHAPNERFSIAMLLKGIASSAAFLTQMART